MAGIKNLASWLWTPNEPSAYLPFTMSDRYCIQSVRVCALCLLITIIAYYVSNFGLYTFSTLSMLAWATTLLSSTLNCWAAWITDEQRAKRCGVRLQRAAWAWFEVAVTVEVSLTLFYWPLVYQGPYPFDIAQCFRVLLHTFPVGYLLFEYWLLPWVFSKRHLLLLCLYGVLYTAINGACTLATGVPIYKMLPWNNLGTAFVLISFNLLMLSVFLALLALKQAMALLKAT